MGCRSQTGDTPLFCFLHHLFSYTTTPPGFKNVAEKCKLSANNLVIADNLLNFAIAMINVTKNIIYFAMQNESFCIHDLFDYLAKRGEISQSSVKSTITRLVKANKLTRLQRGIYAYTDGRQKSDYKAVVDERERHLYFELRHRFPFAHFCVYNGGSLASLQHHLFYNNATYIETDRAAMESVFYTLRSQGRDVYLNPKLEVTTLYIDFKKAPIIIKPLTTESPLHDSEGVMVPTLEKLLIDIRKDVDIFYLQGAEYENIIYNANSLYKINHSRLNRYGRRRGISIAQL